MKRLKTFINKSKGILLNFKKKHIKNSINKQKEDFIVIKKSNKWNLDDIITIEFVFKIWLALLLIVYIWYIAFNSLDIIYLVITAFIISMAAESTIWFFSKFLYRWVAVIISYIFLFTFLILWFVVLIPFLITNSSQILDIVSQKISYLQEQLQTQSLQSFIHSLHLYPYFENKLLEYISNPEIANKIREILSTNISNILQTFAQSIKWVSSFTINVISAFFNAINQIIIVFTLAVFFSFEKNKVVYTLATLSKNPDKTYLKLKKLYFQLWEWLKWQLLLWIFIWLAVYLWLLTLSLFWINLNTKWTLALIAWLMEFIPYLWPILWSLPSLLLASLSYWFWWFLWVWLLFVIIQQVEWWIVPIIMNKALWVNPLLIMISMLFGMKILGFLWIIFAIPIAVIISLAFEDKLAKEK